MRMWQDVNILCVGDVMLDTYVYGSVDRLSPEAPVPVLLQKKVDHMCGGAANVAHNIVTLGANVSLVGAVGKDFMAQTLRAAMPKHVDCHFVEYDDHPTIHKKRFITQGKHLLRVDEEVQHTVSSRLEDDVINLLDQLIKEKQYHVIIGSDYAKGLLTQRICHKMMSLGIPVIFDPKGSDYTRYKGATCISPNLKELHSAAPHGSLQERAQYIAQTFGIENVLVTQGAEGMTLFPKNDAPFHVAAEAKEVFDVSGAGDTVIATLAVAYGSGRDLRDSVELANRAGGIVVSKVGTSTVTYEQLMGGATHHLTWQEEIEQWRQKGYTIGFTNGCFDCLHPGHLHLLRQAKRLCQRLVIGLNSDASVKRLKGESRPIQTEDVRATILDALPEVDLVVVFDEDTPFNLIKKVMPNVLVKGADYTVENVVGADIVMKNGGKVALAELLPGHSTTSMVQRISTES